MKDLLGYLFCAAIVAWLVWELWSGFARGVVHSGYSGRATRVDQPITFWAFVCAYALVLAFFLVFFAVALITSLAH